MAAGVNGGGSYEAASHGPVVHRPDESLSDALEEAAEAVAVAAAAMGLEGVAGRVRDLASWRLAAWRR